MARSGLICFLALTAFNMAMSMPTQRDARFLDFSDPNTQIASLAGLGVAALAANNLLSGNDRIRVRPNLSFNYDPETSALTPALTANVQVNICILFYKIFSSIYFLFIIRNFSQNTI